MLWFIERLSNNRRESSNYRSLMLTTLFKKSSLFFCEFWEIVKNTFFTEHLRATCVLTKLSKKSFNNFHSRIFKPGEYLIIQNIPNLFQVSMKIAMNANFHSKEPFIKRYVKSVSIRSYSGPYFPAFGQNTDQNNSEYGHFLRSESCLEFSAHQYLYSLSDFELMSRRHLPGFTVIKSVENQVNSFTKHCSRDCITSAGVAADTDSQLA